MTWLTERDRNARPAGDRLAALWAQPGIVRLPGAHDPLAALLARRAGFEALYLSGAAVTATLALPDLGILTLDELTFFTRSICRAVDLPLVVDGDTGYGEVLNVMRLVRELEDAAAARGRARAARIQDGDLAGHRAARCRAGDGGVLRRAGRDGHADGATRADAIATGAVRRHRL